MKTSVKKCDFFKEFKISKYEVDNRLHFPLEFTILVLYSTTTINAWAAKPTS